MTKRTQKSSHPARRRHNIQVSRMMRRNPTPAEDLLWQHLRNKQLGVRFRRQHSIDRYIVDFYCAEVSLVIEIDGPIHAQPNSDAERQEALEALGLRVLRFTNDDLARDLPTVIARIRSALT